MAILKIELNLGQSSTEGVVESDITDVINPRILENAISIEADGLEFFPDDFTVNEFDTEELAKRMYTAYCKRVGGKAFNGDPLPDAEEFFNDDGKSKQAQAWIAAAAEAEMWRV